MSGMGLYRLQGHTPVRASDVLTWSEWFESANRQVALSESEGVVISTVFLGVDHQYVTGPPRFFETLVCGGALDGQIHRYATWDEAVAGHAHIVAQVSAPPVEPGKREE